MQLKPEEISKVIRSQIKYYENAIRQDETGRTSSWLTLRLTQSRQET